MNTSKAVGAGAFILLGALLFTVVLFTIGERRMLFQTRVPLHTEFAALGQLQSGALVRVAGMEAGSVTRVQIPATPAQPFRVRMEIREDLRHLVRTDSFATTQTEGLVGALFVNISAGTDAAPVVEDEGTIPGRDPFQVSDLMQQASDTITMVSETVLMLRDDVETTIHTIALTAEDLRLLVEEVRPDIVAIGDDGRRIAEGTQAIVASINEGTGTIGKLIHDDTLYVRVREIADEAKAVMDNVREASNEARQAISDFGAEDSPAQGLMADMRMTMSEARAATAGLADNMDALRHNFLLRGFFNRRGYFDLNAISPMEYRQGVLEGGRRRALRIWLSADVLFVPGQADAEVLSADGRARIDSAMVTYLKYLPTNPLVVEGYATSGTAGERFSLSGRRAEMVRDYLMGRYRLRPQHTGAIALAEDAEGSPTGARWSGVALTLFLDRDELQFR